MQSSDAERERFVQRLDEHQGILHRIAAVYASRPEDRRDLVQEIVLQLWRARASFEERSRFSTWAYRVALNTALSFRRAQRNRPAPAELDEPASPVAPEPGDDVEALERAIRELPELDRAVILLRLEEKSYEEIAAITGLGRASVGVRLVRIKERLHRRLSALHPSRNPR